MAWIGSLDAMSWEPGAAQEFSLLLGSRITQSPGDRGGQAYEKEAGLFLKRDV